MKILAIGRNYAEHAAELGNALPEEPLLFMKAETALLKDNKPFFYPNFSTNIHYELELVIRIGKNSKTISEKHALDYIDSITVGLDLTARDWQDKLKQAGQPWEKAKSFDHSAIVGEMIPFSEIANKDSIDFYLLKNGREVQRGNSQQMIHHFTKILAYSSQFFSFRQGDLVFTGTPKGVGPITIGDNYEAFLNNKKLLHCEIK
jgi:2-keto-4-pentenoate hydratase/2-oxohepta-3-ene-1,7-dioic acid hydratase in catechol pathway